MFARVEVWLVLFLAILCGLGLAAWAFSIKTWHVYPYKLIREAESFVKGHPADRRSIAARLQAEFVHDPAEFALGASPSTGLVPPEELRPVQSAASPGGIVPDIGALSFFGTETAKRYFVVFGSFAFPNTHFGAIAMDTDGVVYRGWAIKPDIYGYLGPDLGLAIDPDGVVATNAHGVLTAYDWCGAKLWGAPWDGESAFPPTETYYHHDIVARDGSFVTFRGPAIMSVDAASGAVRSEVHIVDLVRWAWQGGLSIFDARRSDNFSYEALSPQFYSANLEQLYVNDPFHLNKIDVLTSELAPLYPGFEAGDILVSLRELNLVVVARPSEERIIWWRTGLFSGQHDASFVEGGIEIFDNNISSTPPQPRILRLDLDSWTVQSAFDLSRWGLVARRGGNFERRGDRLLVVGDGRLVVGTLAGEIEFLLNNRLRTDDGQLVDLPITNATEVEPEQFARWQSACGARG